MNADLLRQLEALEALPLLGASLVEARARHRQISAQLAARPDALLLLRNGLHFGQILLVLEAPDAGSHLLALARRAVEQGQAQLATRADLLAVRALWLRGRCDSARQALQRAAHAEHEPGTPQRTDWLLARAWTGPMDAERLLEEALELIPGHRDHDRLAALLLLGDLYETGGDPYRARRCLEQALVVAQTHGADRRTCRVSALLAGLLLRSGDPQGAHEHVLRAVERAIAADDSLVLLSQTTVLAALQLGQGAWQDLLATTALQLDCARQRNNPAAMADAALSRATACFALQEPGQAFAVLLRVGQQLQAAGEVRALNLLRARLAELRHKLGAQRFGELVRAGMKA